MPSPRRELMTSEIRRMRELRAAGATYRQTALMVGRSDRTVTKYTAEDAFVVRSRRYAEWVKRVAIYVPVFGGA